MLKCQIVGNIGSDPEVRYTAEGKARLTFNVASNGRTRNPAGEWQDATEWVRCTVFGPRAETLSAHLVRGPRVYVDGKLESRPWLDRSNQPRAGLELIADSVEFVSSRQRDEHQDRQPVGAGARYATGSDDFDISELEDSP